MTQAQVLRGILGVVVGGEEEAPSTPEGKFLALALCLRAELRGASLPGKPDIFSSVQISSRLGARAYQDLVRCQWIQGRRFNPSLNEGRWVSEHIEVIRYLLNGSQSWAEGHFAKLLSVKNRLLLVILLDQSSTAGRVGPVSLGQLSKLTGFTLNQVKVQLQKLKEIGLVSGVVPGMTGATLFGVAESYIYLNFLHPYWSDFFPGWRAVCLEASFWQSVAKDESENLHRLMGASGHAELVKRPELRRYFRNLTLTLISDALSRDWHFLRLNNWTDTIQLFRLVADRRLRTLSAGSCDRFSTALASIASQLQSELCKGDGDLMTRIGLDPLGPWCFCVLPQFCDQPKPMIIFTNCPHLSSEIDANWLRRSGHDLWIEQGLVTNPDAAPRKLRSYKLKAI